MAASVLGVSGEGNGRIDVASSPADRPTSPREIKETADPQYPDEPASTEAIWKTLAVPIAWSLCYVSPHKVWRSGNSVPPGIGIGGYGFWVLGSTG
ncbi:uncharacterized protein N7482_006268 [Penicillium canariense]|uniref:Uncharacterized protein n=1 Tax=Penicillium canariense TaxID=189055 RepID=A0A9W9LNB6_9EURO|nr:uncharacterized protein N7482_006268 [Penicillium canariense]KAJ5167487.1 hypothetical protein N7482_006268 [Penicillium canariense]